MTRDADGASGTSEKRFRALLANVADMVTISDRDGRIIYASPATERVSGFTPEDFMARDPFDSIHPEDRPRCEEALAMLASSPGLSLDLEHRVRHKDGTWRWVEGTFTSLYDDPAVGGLLATVHDITGRKRAEESSRRAAELDAFRVTLSDPVEIQARAARVLGERLGANRVMYAAVEDDGNGELAVAVIAQCYASGASPLTGRFKMADFGLGRAKPHQSDPVVVVDVSSDPNLTDEERARYVGAGIGAWVGVPLVKGGRYVAALGVHQRGPRDWTPQEITLVEETAERTWDAVERARAEAALRESEERLHLALDAAEMGTFLWHVDEDRGEPDTQMLRLFGLPADGTLTLAEALDTLIHPDDRAGYAEAVARATDPAGDGSLREDIRVVRPGGSERWLAITAQTLFETGPRRAVRMSGVATDITEWRRAEEERERLRVREAAMRAETKERERISRELHDRVAHSMGVAYQSLQLYRALAESAPERARERLVVAEETTKNALDQTRNLAIELRHSVAEETENGVATALRTLLETSTHDGVDAGFSFAGDESLVPHDVGAQVYLVMREAVRNALRHSGCKGLEASLQIHPGEVVGTVTDDGDGFEPASGDAHLAGIGLRSMRERAEMVGGELNLITHPGDGTSIEIRVPL